MKLNRINRKCKALLFLIVSIGFLGFNFGTGLSQESERDKWQKPTKVIVALKIKPGTVVADIGCGSGYFTLRIAPVVGDSGHVYAVDIDTVVLNKLRQKIQEKGFTNVTTIVGEHGDPLLPDGAIDVVMMVNTYHEVKEREAMLESIKRDLKKDGIMAIIDMPPRGPDDKHFLDKQTVLDEVQSAGYILVRERRFLDKQFFLIFKKASEEETKQESNSGRLK